MNAELKNLLTKPACCAIRGLTYSTLKHLRDIISDYFTLPPQALCVQCDVIPVRKGPPTEYVLSFCCRSADRVLELRTDFIAAVMAGRFAEIAGATIDVAIANSFVCKLVGNPFLPNIGIPGEAWLKKMERMVPSSSMQMFVAEMKLVDPTLPDPDDFVNVVDNVFLSSIKGGQLPKSQLTTEVTTSNLLAHATNVIANLKANTQQLEQDLRHLYSSQEATQIAVESWSQHLDETEKLAKYLQTLKLPTPTGNEVAQLLDDISALRASGF
eukprot:TRINITY_DN47338_c0_g1_i1.p1 TRINITY_DN47338_c0_g1~~TRINITY_DN47338_c0_g1_i1.p1  ORF type:complete len:270 (-),score=25.68 TRINITY_DN47338_c0_g1_i1:315-1124(-)